VRQKAEGVKRKLACLTLADPAAVAIGNEPLRHGEEIVGWISSGGYGYSVGKSIALAYLPVALAAPGTALTVEFLGERIAATVARDPLWDPKGARIRA